MATQVAAARQPFAPLNGSRLQNLTSLKNRQNGTARPHLLHSYLPHHLPRPTIAVQLPP
jgi:hypothetical protein